MMNHCSQTSHRCGSGVLPNETPGARARNCSISRNSPALKQQCRMFRYATFLLLCNCSLVPIWASFAPPAVQFQATGHIKITYYNLGEPTTNTSSLDFALRSRGDLWLIRTVPHLYFSNRTACLVKYYESASDGTNLYHVLVFNEDYDKVAGGKEFVSQLEGIEQRLQATGTDSNSLGPIRQLRKLAVKSIPREGTKPSKPRNGAVSEITPGDVPIFQHDDLIAPLWLAYCSGGRFLGTRGQLAPALFSELELTFSRASNLFTRVDCTVLDRQPKLPSLIDFLDDGAVYKSPRASAWPVLRSAVTPGRESTNASYRVANVRECDGLLLPAAFSLVKLSPTPEASGIEFEISGVLESAALSMVNESFLPAVPVVSRVQDNRFTHLLSGHPAGYFTEPLHWPGLSEVMSTREYQLTVQQVTSRQSQPKHRKIILCLLFLTLLVAPVLGYAVSRSSRKVRRQN
jgi:hypothetical protein